MLAGVDDERAPGLGRQAAERGDAIVDRRRVIGFERLGGRDVDLMAVHVEGGHDAVGLGCGGDDLLDLAWEPIAVEPF